MAIIRRYDEVLTTKASKVSLFQLQEKIKRELEPELTLLKNGIKEQSARIVEQRDKFEQYTNLISQELKAAVLKQY